MSIACTQLLPCAYRCRYWHPCCHSAGTERRASGRCLCHRMYSEFWPKGVGQFGYRRISLCRKFGRKLASRSISYTSLASGLPISGSRLTSLQDGHGQAYQLCSRKCLGVRLEEQDISRWLFEEPFHLVGWCRLHQTFCLRRSLLIVAGGRVSARTNSCSCGRGLTVGLSLTPLG